MEFVCPHARLATHCPLQTIEGRVLIKKRRLHRRPAPDRIRDDVVPVCQTYRGLPYLFGISALRRNHRGILATPPKFPLLTLDATTCRPNPEELHQFLTTANSHRVRAGAMWTAQPEAPPGTRVKRFEEGAGKPHKSESQQEIEGKGWNSPARGWFLSFFGCGNAGRGLFENGNRKKLEAWNIRNMNLAALFFWQRPGLASGAWRFSDSPRPLMFGSMYFLVISAAQRRARKCQEYLGAVKNGRYRPSPLRAATPINSLTATRSFLKIYPPIW